MPSAVIWKQPPLHMSAHSREFRLPLFRRISDDAGADALTSYREMNNSGETVLSDFILECARAAARL